MTDDHYATLGVEPRSDAAVIRAAYLALMRRYHPDKNDSPAAIDRVHAVIAAFAVLGDPEKRLHYDWARRRAAEAAAQPPPSWFGRMPRGLIAGAVALMLLVPISVLRVPLTDPTPLIKPTARPAAIAVEPVPAPVRKELAALPAAPLPIPARAPVVIDPVPSAPRTAELPPRATKQALIAVPAPPIALLRRERPPSRADVRPKELPASANAKCRVVKPGAEAAICNNDNLTALDRTVVTFYNQSLQFGATTNRGALLDSRNNFLARREACRSDACLQSVHLGHLRELSAIVEKRPSEPPL